MWSRNSFSLARSSRSCAIISGVDPALASRRRSLGGLGGTGAGARSRPFLPTIRGAMIAFSTLIEPQVGQLTSLRLTCES